MPSFITLFTSFSPPLDDLAVKCATNKKIVVELLYNYASAVVLQYQDNGHEIESKDIDCAIEFRSQPDQGIGFVIEDLNLRRTGHRCMDSVRVCALPCHFPFVFPLSHFSQFGLEILCEMWNSQNLFLLLFSLILK